MDYKQLLQEQFAALDIQVQQKKEELKDIYDQYDKIQSDVPEKKDSFVLVSQQNKKQGKGKEAKEDLVIRYYLDLENNALYKREDEGPFVKQPFLGSVSMNTKFVYKTGEKSTKSFARIMNIVESIQNHLEDSHSNSDEEQGDQIHDLDALEVPKLKRQ